MGNFMEKELRKRQNMLVESGTGVILLAVWSLIKVNLYLALAGISMDDLNDVAAELGINETFFLIFMIVAVSGVLLYNLMIRLYIGISASAEGKGTPKGYGYLVLAVVVLITDLQTSYHAFWLDLVRSGMGMTFDQFVSLCMEAVSAYVMLELLISGIRVKQLRKKMKV